MALDHPADTQQLPADLPALADRDSTMMLPAVDRALHLVFMRLLPGIGALAMASKVSTVRVVCCRASWSFSRCRQRRGCSGGRPIQDARRFRRVAAGRRSRRHRRADDARDRQGDQERPGLAGPQPEFRRVLRRWDLPRQHRGDEPVRAGVHGVGLEPWSRSLWMRRSTRRWST